MEDGQASNLQSTAGTADYEAARLRMYRAQVPYRQFPWQALLDLDGAPRGRCDAGAPFRVTGIS